MGLCALSSSRHLWQNGSWNLPGGPLAKSSTSSILIFTNPSRVLPATGRLCELFSEHVMIVKHVELNGSRIRMVFDGQKWLNDNVTPLR